MTTFTGTSGNDVLPTIGSDNSGNDTFFALGGDDTVHGGLGDDSVDGSGGNDILYGDAGDDTLSGGSEDDHLYGSTGVDYLDGGGGNDRLDGGTGADTMVGNFGNDTYYVDDVGDVTTEYSASDGADTVYSSITHTLASFVDNLVLTGVSALNGTGNNDANKITGNSAANTLTGLGGNDTLDGKAGADTMIGGTGNDTYVVDNASDVVTELANEGTDTVKTTLSSYTLGANVENLTFTGAGNFAGTGNTLNNVITGGTGNDTLTSLGGNDTLDGKAGADTMIGGTGDDKYYVDNVGDITTEVSAGDGLDTVYSSVTYTLASFVDNLILTGVSALNGTGNNDANKITGNSAANTLTGLGGNDTLDGLAGADTMIGGAGDDKYYVDNVGDITTEVSAGDGVDTVYSSVTRTLASFVDNLILTGASALNGTGNNDANKITGNSAANTLTGLGGNDTLDGMVGADTMIGGTGNDTYVVDNAGDVVTELANEGTDTVKTTLSSYTLGANVENLTFTGAGNFAGTGNTLNNVITGGTGNDTFFVLGGDDTVHGGLGDDSVDGSGGNDILYGDDGDDYLSGGSEDDHLYGGTGVDYLDGGGGNDRLDGGTGADTMVGNFGNDTYYVDDVGDVTTEYSASDGADTVYSSITHTLASFVDNLVLTGASALNGTGNNDANKITGNSAANTLTGLGGNDTLDGKAGADTMIGGTGNDTYVVDNAGDVVTELANEGTDTVKTTLSSYTLGANVENLTFTGAGNFAGTGNTLNNAITGGTGADTLTGGGGKDKLTGGAGADIFKFSAGDSTVASFDTVADFATGADKMDLSIFAGVPSASAYAEITVASDSFATLKSAAQAQMTATVQAVFVAATTNGWLFWNTDANPGTAEEAVMLTGKNNVSNFGLGDLT